MHLPQKSVVFVALVDAMLKLWAGKQIYRLDLLFIPRVYAKTSFSCFVVNKIVNLLE